LPPHERAELVDKLWDSLGDTTYPLLNQNWSAEIEPRARISPRVRPAHGRAERSHDRRGKSPAPNH